MILPNDSKQAAEQMNIVVVGHVDHGKSTVIGRLLADTNSLPQGKLEAVRERCRRNAKPFEYAFLLDALKDEQAQGITIDSARCFFKTAKREYIIIDAPGHIEFLKNMISGAARAEAGLLIIDAREGVQENSRRHGYLMSMLGITQLAVCVNKMDLVGYDPDAFAAIKAEYLGFLSQVGITPREFIPIAALEGENLASRSGNMAWYEGPTVLETLDGFAKAARPVERPLRLPVQDVYKMTEFNDDRRIVAGRIETGRVNVGDEVVFLPSGKKSRVKSVEAFNSPERASAQAGESTGLTLQTQIYIRPGEILCRASDPQPAVSTRLRVNLFWLSPNPMVQGRRYKLKLAAARAPVWLTDIERVMDASNLSTESNRRQIERHEVAVATLELLRPIACDLAVDIPQTGRFVIIDNYEIVGGGVVLSAESVTNSLTERHVRQREIAWDRSRITPGMRGGRYNQKGTMVLISGPADAGKGELARTLEEYLFNCGRVVYYLGLANAIVGLDADLSAGGADRSEYLRRLGEIAHMFGDAGAIFITVVSDLDDPELDLLAALNRPNELIHVNVGENRFARAVPDLQVDRADLAAMRAVHQAIQKRSCLAEYYL